MIYDVIYSLLVLIEKLTFSTKVVRVYYIFKFTFIFFNYFNQHQPNGKNIYKLTIYFTNYKLQLYVLIMSRICSRVNPHSIVT